MTILTEYAVASLEEDHDYSLLATRASQLSRETPGALLFVLDGVESWVPRSLCRQDHRGLWVANWYVEKEGLDG